MFAKITHGFVTQIFDEATNRWVSQAFTAGDECEYERGRLDAAGNFVTEVSCDEYDLRDAAGGIAEPYLPYDMVQPDAEGRLSSRKPNKVLDLLEELLSLTEPNGDFRRRWQQISARAADLREAGKV